MSFATGGPFSTAWLCGCFGSPLRLITRRRQLGVGGFCGCSQQHGHHSFLRPIDDNCVLAFSALMASRAASATSRSADFIAPDKAAMRALAPSKRVGERGDNSMKISISLPHRPGRLATGNGSTACSGHIRHSPSYRGGRTTNSFADSSNRKCRASNDRERRRAQVVRRALAPCRRGRRGLPHLKLGAEAKPQARRLPRLEAHASMSSSPAHLLDPRVQISLDQVRRQVPDKTPVIGM